ncbi:MAG TPA: efflux RND transporter periplasmic adaptor subunit [Candidatus Acidoferrales bacterium]|nr:efflux RND transporter periplasmic adaptor subunit [Candidatus Acidoferrales bacterium]
MTRGAASFLGASGALAAAFVAVLAGCSARESAEQMTSYSAKATKEETAQLFSVPAEQMSHLQIATVTAAPLARTLRLSGAVAYNAFRTTPVISPVGGPVAQILVAPGDHVKLRQPLLEVSSPDYAQLRASYLKAKDTFRVADKNFARAQDLYSHGAIAERDLLQAESDRNQARADLDSNEQTLRILGIPQPDALEKAPPSPAIPLLSPIDGEIVERLVSPGQLLQAGATQAFTISDMSTVWVLANAYQTDLAYLKEDEEVEVVSDAFPDVFRGKISYIAPAVDVNTRTLQARIVVENRGHKLKKDMYVTVTVKAGRVENAIAVPDSAVLRDDENQPFVYVATEDNKFRRRPVEIGQSQDGRTQILRGLSAGEKIVGDGSLFLQFQNAIQH